MWRQVLLLSASLGLSLPVIADTYVIRPDGSGDFPTIQAAIDAVVNGDICILSSNSAELQGGAVACREDSRPEVTECLLCGNSAGSEGGGMWCDYGAGPMTISTCTFRENLSQGNWGGGGLFCYGVASLTLSECVFENNTVTSDCEGGGGLFAQYCEGLSLTGCGFVGNEALETRGGGGMYCYYCYGAELTDCHFMGNATTGTRGGGGIKIYGAEVTLSHCTFAYNTASHEGGAIQFWVPYPANVDHCTFWGNSALDQGGAMVARGAEVNLINCTAYGNAAPLGGGLCVAQEATFMIDNSIFAFSTEGEGVAGVGEGISIALSCCDIYGNAGGDWVGFVADQYGLNGNIHEHPHFCGPEIDDFTLAENSPCAPFTPPNAECDLIGAWPVGCGPAFVPEERQEPAEDARRLTWGKLKAVFGK